MRRGAVIAAVLTMSAGTVGCTEAPPPRPAVHAAAASTADAETKPSANSQDVLQASVLEASARDAFAAGQFDAALRDAQASYALRQKAFGEASPDACRGLELVAQIRTRRGELDDARLGLEKAIGVLEPLGDAQADLLASVFVDLAKVEFVAGNEKARETDLERAVAVAEHAFGVDARRTRELADQLCEVLARRDRARADALRERYHFERIERTKAEASGSGAAAPAASSGAASGGAAPAANGTVADAQVVVASMAASFRRCYNRGLKEDPSVGGVARLTVKVGADGEVDKVVTYVPLGLTKGICECLADVVLAKRFSAPDKGGATIIIPITLLTTE